MTEPVTELTSEPTTEPTTELGVETEPADPAYVEEPVSELTSEVNATDAVEGEEEVKVDNEATGASQEEAVEEPA